ncbi:Hpt domain protein [Planctomycetes bacterium CA13]|uniref:Hpt domain protein n=1 Tax=Novipirellula herctigrandis TaxID=2527986 RepID=A0A5C5Z991_9BACT|nr:Hpt domain protein [Planctomycetes bacterium CA13]
MNSSTERSAPVVNRDELIDRMMGSIPMAERMLKRFVDTANADFDLMESTVRLGDKPAIASLAHRHKGTAQTMAIPRVAQCAAELEQRAHTDPTSKLLAILGEMRMLHDEVRQVQQLGLANLI